MWILRERRKRKEKKRKEHRNAEKKKNGQKVVEGCIVARPAGKLTASYSAPLAHLQTVFIIITLQVSLRLPISIARRPCFFLLPFFSFSSSPASMIRRNTGIYATGKKHIRRLRSRDRMTENKIVQFKTGRHHPVAW